MSFKNKIPTISSIDFSYTGILLYLYSSILSNNSYKLALTSIANISVLCVIISLAVMSFSWNTLLIKSFSSFSIVPFCWPSSIIILISSSVTIFSSFSLTPNIFEIKFVTPLNNFTKGDAITEIKLINPIVPKAIFSEYFIASLFGTNSPNIKVKKDNIIVIIIIENVCQKFIPKLGAHELSIGASFVANVSAANALDRKPASVIPIWIVDKNLLGLSSIFFIFFAFLFPSFACFAILLSFSEI